MARIGKNVLESLTRSMYTNSLCVYREYVQNAADQIDLAKKLHPELTYSITVSIEPEARRVIIEDDATGVESSQVQRLLVDVARSEKIRGVNKGFRGIGRLGGLGYCKTLRFETSYFDEKAMSILTWDAAELNRIVDDPNDDRDAGEVIDQVTNIEIRKDKSHQDEHFFRVIMEDVSDERLLNEEVVRNYLSMVSPVDYNNSFLFRTNIEIFMKEHNFHLDCYDIYVGIKGNEEQIFKSYSTKIYEPCKDGGIKERDTVNGIDFWLETDTDGQPIYWGWYSITNLLGEIPTCNNARNIRLRCENIQLGDENACKIFFNTNDKRFVDWFFGEIHVVSTELIPNSQRDYLREGEPRIFFERHIVNDFLKLKELCNQASDIRSDIKKLKNASIATAQFKEKAAKGFSSESEAQKKQEELVRLQEQAHKAQQRLYKTKEKMQASDSPLQNMFNTLALQSSGLPAKEIISIQKGENPNTPVQKIPTFALRTDNPKYKKMTQHEKDILNKVYKVIDNLVPDDKIKDALIDKIEEAVTR